MSRTRKSPHRPRCYLCHGPKLLGQPPRQEKRAPTIGEGLADRADAEWYAPFSTMDDADECFCVGCCTEGVCSRG